MDGTPFGTNRKRLHGALQATSSASNGPAELGDHRARPTSRSLSVSNARVRRLKLTAGFWPIRLKNCSRLGQHGFAGSPKPSPQRLAFKSGLSVRSNFGAVPPPLGQTSFSTVLADRGRSRGAAIYPDADRRVSPNQTFDGPYDPSPRRDVAEGR